MVRVTFSPLVLICLCVALSTAAWQHIMPLIFPVEWIVESLKTWPTGVRLSWWIRYLGFGAVFVAGFLALKRHDARQKDAENLLSTYLAMVLGSEFFGKPAFLFGGNHSFEVIFSAAICGAFVFVLLHLRRVVRKHGL
jgi:hypothetical protein